MTVQGQSGFQTQSVLGAQSLRALRPAHQPVPTARQLRRFQCGYLSPEARQCSRSGYRTVRPLKRSVFKASYGLHCHAGENLKQLLLLGPWTANGSIFAVMLVRVQSNFCRAASRWPGLCRCYGVLTPTSRYRSSSKAVSTALRCRRRVQYCAMFRSSPAIIAGENMLQKKPAGPVLPPAAGPCGDTSNRLQA